jgi:hypothetical protein
MEPTTPRTVLIILPIKAWGVLIEPRGLVKHVPEPAGQLSAPSAKTGMATNTEKVMRPRKRKDIIFFIFFMYI